jgi:D-tyrosyl-tRNA(Tyr) deacylase
MSSLLKRESQRLACVDLGSNKKQIFETVLCLSRTRSRQTQKNKTVHPARNESETMQHVRMDKTQRNGSRLQADPLDNEEALVKFFSMLKTVLAPCITLASHHSLTVHTNT